MELKPKSAVLEAWEEHQEATAAAEAERQREAQIKQACEAQVNKFDGIKDRLASCCEDDLTVLHVEGAANRVSEWVTLPEHPAVDGLQPEFRYLIDFYKQDTIEGQVVMRWYPVGQTKVGDFASSEEPVVMFTSYTEHGTVNVFREGTCEFSYYLPDLKRTEPLDDIYDSLLLPLAKALEEQRNTKTTQRIVDNMHQRIIRNMTSDVSWH